MSTGAGGPEGPPPQGGQQQGGWTPPPGAPPPPQGAPPQGWGQQGGPQSGPPQGWAPQGGPPQQGWQGQGGPQQGWQTGPGPGQDPSQVIGPRIGAAIIDAILMFILFIVLGAALGGGEADDDGASIALAGGEFLLYIVLWLGYYIGTESAWHATLGKRAVGLVVRSADGSEPSFGQIAGRNVLRVVDGLFFYLVGLITMLVTQRKQRVGDLAAGTIVVKKP